MTGRVEKNGPVTTVINSRPEVRNAVNNESAEALAAAFLEFEADDDALVAVFWGEGGAFCGVFAVCFQHTGLLHKQYRCIKNVKSLSMFTDTPAP